jgi:hypothetical protein
MIQFLLEQNRELKDEVNQLRKQLVFCNCKNQIEK